MRMTVQITLDAGGGEPVVVREVFALERGPLSGDNLGLRVGEAKDLLAAVQDSMVAAQVDDALAGGVPCPDCGIPRRHKDSRTIVVRTLFGRLRLPSPRWWHCRCAPMPGATFSPLAALVPERTTPELRYLQAKFAALVSFELSSRMLAEVLPLGRRLHATALRRQVGAVAERLEAELGDEQFSFLPAHPGGAPEMARPDLPLTVGLDGGYVHSAHQRTRAEGWFEVVAGKSLPADGKGKCFAFVQTHDPKPKRRMFEVLKSQGLASNQQITFLTDGGEDIRDLPLRINPRSEHLLDWFHVTMRLTVMRQMAKGLPDGQPAAVGQELERLKWFLWHGNVFRALQSIDDLVIDLEEDPDPQAGAKQRKLLKTAAEFAGYSRANAGNIPNYGERHRAGEIISTSFVESAVNQVISKRMVKKQQMRWTPKGAHLLLQIRTRVLNGDLADDFHRWYPNFTHEDSDDHAIAA